MTGYFTQSGTADLNAAALMSPDVAAGEAASLPRAVPINANGLPLLNSRANGDGTEMFIDFSRDVGGLGTFSLDADRVNFNFAEQLAIYTCWREIVGFFSQFNVNVTTVQPPTGASDPNFAWIQITNEWSGGNAYVGWLAKDEPKGKINSGDAVNRVSGVIHELGHIMNLNHQGEFDKYGTKTAEYSDGYSYRDRPIMGIDYLGTIRKLTWGRTINATTVQDDVGNVAATAAWSNGAGGDGFRPDDFGDTTATAYTLPTGGQQLDAFTERYTDADVFKITPTTAGPWNITATPAYLSQAEPKLELLDASGNIIAARDDADIRNGPTSEQFLNVTLQPGTYYIRVTSGGDYDELGYYKFAATQLPTGWVSNDVGIPAVNGSVTYNTTTGVFTQGGGGGDIWNYDDQFRYSYATLSGNGSITARVDGLDNLGTYTKAGVMIRQSLNSNSAHAFLGLNPSGNVDSIWRWAPGYNSANVGTGTGPWVRISRTGSTFTFQSSTNGTAWTTLGSRDIPMTGSVYIGLATCAWASSRYEAFSTFSNVAVTGNITPAATSYNGLAAPAGVTAAPAAGANTSIVLNWNAVSGATGYVVEQSVNGIDFTSLATVGTGVLTYTHSNPAGSMRYFYRVSASNGTSLNSTPSSVVSAVNKPSAPVGTPGGFTPTAMSVSTSEIDLTWLDTSGETGYRIEQSTDGINFTTRYTNGANHILSNLNGLTQGTAYTFRITPLTSIGDGVASPLIVNTETRMTAVGNLRFTSKSSTSMSIAWDDKTIETGYRVERSTDGTNWTFQGDAAANVTTWSETGLTPGTEYYYRIMPWTATYNGDYSGAIMAAAPAVTQPVGWADADVGTVAGSGTGLQTAAGAWSLVSGGFDVAGSADAMHFTYRGLTGNRTLIAKVETVETTDNAAKAGIMIRQDLTAGSKFTAIMMNAGGGYGIDVRSRTTANTGYTYQQALGNVTAPYWLKLVRSGSVVTASYSSDGTTWTQAAAITLSLSGKFYIGLATTSFSTTYLNTSTFSNVSISDTTPTITTAATGAPSNVSGLSTTLSILGADDGDENQLTYTWSTTGTPPAPVAFTANGANAAKACTAMFIKAGVYTLQCTVFDGALSTTSNVTITVGSTLTSLSVSPNTSNLSAGDTQVFSVVAYDQFGEVMTTPTITWSLGAGSSGSISASGIYTAGTGSATVIATSGSVTSSAAVTVASARPTIATPASVATSTITGTSVGVSVLGADDQGEASLIYSWSVASGPAPVQFSDNRTNSAKNATALFHAAGNYVLAVTITDPSGNTVTSSTSVSVVQTPTKLNVTPNSASIGTGTTKQFFAAATDQFGVTIASPAVNWSIAGGGGTISGTGLFTAPASAGITTIRATLGALVATRTVSVFSWSPYNTTLKSISSTGLQVSFRDSTTVETGFQIQVGVRQSNGNILWTTTYSLGASGGSGGTVTYTLPQTFAPGTWYVRVRATSASGNSNWSNAASKTL